MVQPLNAKSQHDGDVGRVELLGVNVARVLDLVDAARGAGKDGPDLLLARLVRKQPRHPARGERGGEGETQRCARALG